VAKQGREETPWPACLADISAAANESVALKAAKNIMANSNDH